MESKTKPTIFGQALLQTYLLLGPGWNGSTLSSQVKAGTAQWVPKHMSQDTTNQRVYTGPKEKWGKNAQALLPQQLSGYKAPGKVLITNLNKGNEKQPYCKY